MAASPLSVAAQSAAWLGLGVAFLLGAWGPALGFVGLLAVLASTRRRFFAPARAAVERTVSGRPRQGSLLTVVVEAKAPTTGLVDLDVPVPLGFNLVREKRSAGRGRARVEQEVQPVAVGDVQWPPVKVRVTDVWGLESQVEDVPAPSPMTILPDHGWALHGRRLGQRHPVKARVKAVQASERALEIESVRRLVPGDSLRDIDWKASARFLELQVRQRERHAPRPVTVVLDCTPGMRAQRHDSKLLSAARVAYGILATASGAGTTSRLVRVSEAGCARRMVGDGRDAEAALSSVLHECSPLPPGQATAAPVPAAQVAQAVAEGPGLQVLILDAELQPDQAIELLALLRLRGPVALVVPATGAHLYRRGEARGPVLAALVRWRRDRDRVRAAANRLRVPFLVLRPGSEADALAHLGRMFA
jgi:uncharacterized protein (DUF58 family)